MTPAWQQVIQQIKLDKAGAVSIPPNPGRLRGSPGRGKYIPGSSFCPLVVGDRQKAGSRAGGSSH